MARNPAVDPNSVHAVMDTLEGIRGYPSGCYAREAKAVKWMLGKGYTSGDILDCYQHLKKEHFWAEKSLTMTSVANQIGEWKHHRDSQGDQRGKYQDAIEARQEVLRQWTAEDAADES